VSALLFLFSLSPRCVTQEPFVGLVDARAILRRQEIEQQAAHHGDRRYPDIMRG
jgi:hypothetical protein